MLALFTIRVRGHDLVYESEHWPRPRVSVSAIDSRCVRYARQRWEPFGGKNAVVLEPLDGGGQTDRRTDRWVWSFRHRCPRINLRRKLSLPSMKCIRALFSVSLSYFLRSRNWSWCEFGERPVGTSTDGTPAGEVWLRLNICFFPLENQEQKARASRSRASLLNTIAILWDRVVCQYSSTIARREQDAPPPNSHQ